MKIRSKINYLNNASIKNYRIYIGERKKFHFKLFYKRQVHNIINTVKGINPFFLLYFNKSYIMAVFMLH